MLERLSQRDSLALLLPLGDALPRTQSSQVGAEAMAHTSIRAFSPTVSGAFCCAIEPGPEPLDFEIAIRGPSAVTANWEADKAKDL
jgi:hypothetical protein